MAINFPANPSNLDPYTDPTSGVVYTYNSSTDSWTGASANSTIFADLTTTQTINGAKTFSSPIIANLTGNLTGNVTGSVTGSVTGTATNATKLNNLTSDQYLRSDVADVCSGAMTFSAGIIASSSLTLNDNVRLNFGTGSPSDVNFFTNGTDLYTDFSATTNNWYIRKGTVTKFTLTNSGIFTATGAINAGGMITGIARVQAGNHSAANVAFQFAGRADSGLGFPSNEDCALFAGGEKIFAIKSNSTTYWGTDVDDNMAPGQNNTKNGVRLNAGGAFIQKRNSSNNSGVAAQLGGNTGLFEVRNDGDCLNTNGRYEQASDERLKENIVDAKSQWEDIKALRWINYNYKPETNMPQNKMFGVVAQEAEKVCPSITKPNEVTDGTPWEQSLKDEVGDSYMSIAYSLIAMKAAKALQEALLRIEQLEAKVEALENA